MFFEEEYIVKDEAHLNQALGLFSTFIWRQNTVYYKARLHVSV